MSAISMDIQVWSQSLQSADSKQTADITKNHKLHNLTSLHSAIRLYKVLPWISQMLGGGQNWLIDLCGFAARKDTCITKEFFSYSLSTEIIRSCTQLRGHQEWWTQSTEKCGIKMSKENVPKSGRSIELNIKGSWVNLRTGGFHIIARNFADFLDRSPLTMKCFMYLSHIIWE